MACQKVCKQGKDDIIVKVNLQSPIPTSFTLQLQTNVKTMQVMMRLCKFAFTIISSLYTLFAYFLACHPYILLHFLSLVYCMFHVLLRPILYVFHGFSGLYCMCFMASQAYTVCVSCASQAYTVCVSCVSQVYTVCVSCASQAYSVCFMCFSGVFCMFHVLLRRILCVCILCFSGL